MLISPGSAASRVQRSQQGTNPNGTQASYALPEYQEGGKIPGAQRPAESNYLKASYERQKKMAQDYAGNLQKTGDNIYNTYAQEARSQLPGMIQKNREDFNSRGLLQSGKEREAEAGTIGGVQRKLAETRSGINRELNQNLAQLEGNQFNTAGLLAQPGPQTAQTELQGISTQLGANSQSNQTNAALIGAILGGGSSLAGAGLANNMMSQNGGGATNQYTMGTVNGVDYNKRYSPTYA